MSTNQLKSDTVGCLVESTVVADCLEDGISTLDSRPAGGAPSLHDVSDFAPHWARSCRWQGSLRCRGPLDTGRRRILRC